MQAPVFCGQVEHQSGSDCEKRDVTQRIAEREEALHQANVSTQRTLLMG